MIEEPKTKKPIGAMTIQEIQKELKDSDINSSVRSLLETWMDIKRSEWIDEYPEYYL